MDARYLTTDCLLTSDSDLGNLVSFLGERIFLLWNESSPTGHRVGLETKLINASGPQEDIQEFAAMFTSLPDDLAQLLKACREKVFDIGFEGGTRLHLDAGLDAHSIALVHSLGFSLNIRIYPADAANKEP